MILKDALDKVYVSLVGAITTNQLQCTVDYVDAFLNTNPKGTKTIPTNGVANVVLLAGVAGSTIMTLSALGIYNADTVDATVIIKYNTTTFYKKTLKPGETLQYTENLGFFLANEQPLTDTELRATPVPVSVTVLPLPTGASTEATLITRLSESGFDAKQALLLAELQLKADLTETQPVSLATIPLAAGAATEAKQDAEIVLAGALTETAPATDTASSGLNGRLQRIAQRLTSLITALGSPFQAGGSIGNTAFAKTKTALIANEAVSVTCNSTTTVLVASNASRKGLVITNTGSNNVFIGIGVSAVLNQGIFLVANGGVWVTDDYTFTTQAINGITISSTSNISIQEFQ